MYGICLCEIISLYSRYTIYCTSIKSHLSSVEKLEYILIEHAYPIGRKRFRWPLWRSRNCVMTITYLHTPRFSHLDTNPISPERPTESFLAYHVVHYE